MTWLLSFRPGVVVRVLVLLVALGPWGAARAAEAPSAAELADAVREAHAAFRDLTDGAPADYIPELARVAPDLFGVVIVTAAGEVFAVGDVDHAFSIQSVSKPFTAALVMQQRGAGTLAEKIGVEPTGQKFNSILATQILPQVSANPLVNSGAIAAVSLVEADSAQQRFDRILDWFDRLAAARLAVIEDVYHSEAATNERNRGHAYILAASGRLYADPLETTDVYTRQCAIGITARQMAVMGATLANGGVNPVTGERVLDARHVPRVLSLMLTAGFYNESGAWSYTAGLPAKTGVGGGIVAVAPGRLAIAAFSPRLNDAGNSIRAMKAIEFLSERFGLGVFGSGR